METKGRRAFREAGTVEIPRPQPVPANAPSEIAAETATAAGPAAAEPGHAADAAATHISVAAPSVAAPMQGAPRDDPRGRDSLSDNNLSDIGREAFAALVESRLVLANGFEALSEECAGLARSGIDAAARTAIGMLGVKTLADAIEVNAGFARTSFDHWIGGSAKLSELGAKLAAESAQPFLTRSVNAGWRRDRGPASAVEDAPPILPCRRGPSRARAQRA
jgi:hypothetical protein